MFKGRLVVAGAAVALAVLAPAAAASADDYVNTSVPTVPTSQVEGTILTRAPKVLGTTQTRSATLPVTGGDIAELTFIGLAAVGTGTVLVRRSRRSQAQTA